jgi:hypothetical protein
MRQANIMIESMVDQAERNATAQPMTLIRVGIAAPGLVPQVAWNPDYSRLRYFIDPGKESQPVARPMMLAALRWQCRPHLWRGDKLTLSDK